MQTKENLCGCTSIACLCVYLSFDPIKQYPGNPKTPIRSDPSMLHVYYRIQSQVPSVDSHILRFCLCSFEDCVCHSYPHISNPVRSSSLSFPPLPRERHEPGIQRQWQEKVTEQHTRQRRHRLYLRDRPTIGHKVRDSQHHHTRPHNKTKTKAEPKLT